MQTNSNLQILNCCARAIRSSYWIELATLEKALLAFDPIKRMVPTTRTRITASITAYSAISCPASSDQILRISSDMLSSKTDVYSLREERTLLGESHNARWRRCLSNGVFDDFHTKNDDELKFSNRGGRPVKCSSCRRRRLLHHLLSGVLRISQHGIRKHAQINRRRSADGESPPQPDRHRHYCNLLPRLAHVHDDNDAQVIVGPDRAIDNTNDRKPDKVRLHSGAEHVKLGEESARDRD